MSSNKRLFVITSGGTSEYIDSVRKITNSSSGKLGCLIAKEIIKDDNNKIIYIHSKGAIKLEHSNIDNIEVVTTKDLELEVTNVLKNNKVDVFIHSMAVSDYSVKNIIDLDKLREAFENRNEDNFDNILNKCIIDNSKKISSKNKNPLIALSENPKIISIIKKISPFTFLVGFKLLDNVSEDELFDIGFNLLRKNRCNLVLANDISKIRQGKHIGMLIYPEKNKSIIKGKDSIAKTLMAEIYNRAFVKHPKSIQLSNVNNLSENKFESIKGIGEILYKKGILPEVINHDRIDKIGTYGNMSFKNSENSFYITGRNVHKGKLKKEDVCLIEEVEDIVNDSIYSHVKYHGIIKPSIDTSIHAKIYSVTNYTHIVHIHTDKLFLGDFPVTSYNYPCGSMEERDAIIKFILDNKNSKIIQLYKHGLIVLGNSFNDCLNEINSLYENNIYIDYNDYNNKHSNKEFINHIVDVQANFVYNEGNIYPIKLSNNSIGSVWENRTNNNDLNFALYLNKKERNKKHGLIHKYLKTNKSNNLFLHTKEECNVANLYIEKFNFKIFENYADKIILKRS